MTYLLNVLLIQETPTCSVQSLENSSDEYRTGSKNLDLQVWTPRIY